MAKFHNSGFIGSEGIITYGKIEQAIAITDKYHFVNHITCRTKTQ